MSKQRRKNKKNRESENCEDSGATNGKGITKHHVIPRSRGGKEKDVVRIPGRYHDAWHIFFGNLTLEEAIYFIEIVFSRKGRKHARWTVKDLYDLQLKIQSKSKKYD